MLSYLATSKGGIPAYRIAGHRHSAVTRCLAHVAVQPRLGILPERRSWIAAHHPLHRGAGREALSFAAVRRGRCVCLLFERVEAARGFARVEDGGREHPEAGALRATAQCNQEGGLSQPMFLKFNSNTRCVTSSCGGSTQITSAVTYARRKPRYLPAFLLFSSAQIALFATLMCAWRTSIASGSVMRDRMRATPSSVAVLSSAAVIDGRSARYLAKAAALSAWVSTALWLVASRSRRACSCSRRAAARFSALCCSLNLACSAAASRAWRSLSLSAHATARPAMHNAATRKILRAMKRSPRFEDVGSTIVG